VKRSTKTGIASAALLLSIFLPPYSEWRAPINFACAVLACVLGLLAASSGRRWWLVIPVSIIVGFVADLYIVMCAM
jgi:hypothetical protein